MIRTATILVVLLGIASVLPYFSPLYAVEFTTATLVNTIQSSTWSPPSPDPAGVTYNPDRGTIVVVDSEVEEMAIYQGKNMFEITYNGIVLATHKTTQFSNEPTDIAYNPVTGRYFFSDDDQRKIFEVQTGADGTIGTSDDTVTSFSTTAFGNTDPEGIAYGENKLFIADGTGSEVYILSPGTNNRFDGVSPGGDDTAIHFDTSIFGIKDPEGIEYNPDRGTIFLVDYTTSTKFAVEVALDGTLLKQINIQAAAANHPAGVTYAPASTNPTARHLYIVDRNVDNDNVPTENDGKLYELSMPSVPTTTPLPTFIPTSTLIPTPTPVPGDITGDNHVTLADLSILLSNFGKPGATSLGDVNGSGTIDLQDLSIVLSNFGK